MNMAIRSFTAKKIRELAETLSKLENEINILKSKTEKSLWLADLQELETALEKFNAQWAKDHTPSDKKKKKGARNVKKGQAKKKKQDDDKDGKKIKPKKLPGIDDDETSQSTKANTQISENGNNTTETKKKPRQKKEKDVEVDEKQKDKKPRVQKKKKVEVVDESEGSLGDVVSSDSFADSVDDFVVGNKKKNKNKFTEEFWLD